MRRFRVGHGEAKWIVMRGADERTDQSTRALLVEEIGFGLQLLDSAADFAGGRCGGHGFAETHGDGIGNPTRHFPEEAAALEAENAAPDAIEIDRHDGRVDALHDALEAVAEGEHLADARNLTFGKDADDFAVADGVAGFAEG